MVRSEELPYGIEECALYPLFTPELIDLMRRLIPREHWAHVARAVTFIARKGSAPVAAEDSCETTADPPGDQDGTRMELPNPDLMWDFGAAGCEEGALLRVRSLVAGLAPGQVLEIRTTDPGAREDLPAGCRMTGHEYLGSHGHRYLVRKR